jgi:hypothetical protein
MWSNAQLSIADSARGAGREQDDHQPTGATKMSDDLFGLCPHCRETDDVLYIGKELWVYCVEHKTKWCAGYNLLSGWRFQSVGEQRAIYDNLGFSEYQVGVPVTANEPISLGARVGDDDIPF